MFHCRASKSTSFNRILSQLNYLHTITSRFLEIHFNIILPSKPWLLSLTVLTKHFCIYDMSIIVHFIPLNWIALLILHKTFELRSSSLCNFFPSPYYFLPLRSKYDFAASTLFSNRLGLYSSLRMRNRISRRYKTTDEMIISCIYFSL
jgi:hypothetical protein